LLEHLYNPTAWASDVFFYVTWHWQTLPLTATADMTT
jgi:hypothetical protein